MLPERFIFLNFNYCPLVCHFCSAALSQKREKIQERVLRLLYNDSYSSYNILLIKTARPTMEVSRLRRLAIKVFKTLKSFNQDFMHTDFRRNGLVVNRAKTTKFDEKILRTLGPKIWNSLPEDVKDLLSLPKFNGFIKTWYGPECRCNICKYSGNPHTWTHYTWTSHLRLNMSQWKSHTQHQQTKNQT